MSEFSVVYVIGYPGAGKTSVLRAALGGQRGRQLSKPFAMRQFPGGVVLGAERGAFSGTDALPMDAQPLVIAWLRHLPVPVVVGEGDRLGNSSFFNAVKVNGYRLEVVLLDVEPELAAQRRAARGSAQDDTWLKGRISKVDALASYVTHRLDGRLPLNVLGQELADLYPFGKLLTGRRGALLRRQPWWALSGAYRSAATVRRRADAR